MYIYNIIYVLTNTYRTVFQTDYCVYYMLFGIFTGDTFHIPCLCSIFPSPKKKGGDTGSYSLSVCLCSRFPEPKAK